MRQDPERESDLTHAAEAGLPPAEAMTDTGVNDTSVIRGPAIKKAGRREAYGPVQQTGVWCVPLYEGVEDKYRAYLRRIEIKEERREPDWMIVK